MVNCTLVGGAPPRDDSKNSTAHVTQFKGKHCKQMLSVFGLIRCTCCYLEVWKGLQVWNLVWFGSSYSQTHTVYFTIQRETGASQIRREKMSSLEWQLHKGKGMDLKVQITNTLWPVIDVSRQVIRKTSFPFPFPINRKMFCCWGQWTCTTSRISCVSLVHCGLSRPVWVFTLLWKVCGFYPKSTLNLHLLRCFCQTHSLL